ncbi:MAG: hypothetical protein CMK59_06020 [Proteobacteria bacterium]|nr:hypothetical protein [Pseudomonadota bacterium]
MGSYQQQNSSNQQALQQVDSNQQNQQGQEAQNELGNAALVEILQQQDSNAQNIHPVYADYYQTHRDNVSKLNIELSSFQMTEVRYFISNWEKNKNRYQAVASQTNMPAELIAAIHWRESSGNFNTYLHQGDPLGKPAVNWPNNIPVFHNWEKAAVHALSMKDNYQEDLGITSDTTDAALMGLYAEGYNGFGYRKTKDKVNTPYVYSGTNAYSQGKFVSDGHFSKKAVDQQVGVIPLLGSIDGAEAQVDISPKQLSGSDVWTRVLGNQKVLKQGDYSVGVLVLQQKLYNLGYTVTVDGDFGSRTEKAVKQFQRERGLGADGVVGAGTGAELDKVLLENGCLTETEFDNSTDLGEFAGGVPW